MVLQSGLNLLGFGVHGLVHGVYQFLPEVPPVSVLSQGAVQDAAQLIALENVGGVEADSGENRLRGLGESPLRHSSGVDRYGVEQNGRVLPRLQHHSVELCIGHHVVQGDPDMLECGLKLGGQLVVHGNNDIASQLLGRPGSVGPKQVRKTEIEEQLLTVYPHALEHPLRLVLQYGLKTEAVNLHSVVEPVSDVSCGPDIPNCPQHAGHLLAVKNFVLLDVVLHHNRRHTSRHVPLQNPAEFVHHNV
mmetsp:Transcript_44411/g.96644  ORF Transcript_44411/g.96644 Transcript_44411/m.96644 type:complete len:247 (+) Transcript_44411:537-1277(+)